MKKRLEAVFVAQRKKNANRDETVLGKRWKTGEETKDKKEDVGTEKKKNEITLEKYQNG